MSLSSEARGQGNLGQPETSSTARGLRKLSQPSTPSEAKGLGNLVNQQHRAKREASEIFVDLEYRE